MLHSAINAFVLLFLINRVNVSLATEPVCSKFDYEEKLLEKVIRQEIKVETMRREIVKTQDSVLNTLNEIKKKVGDINDRFEDLRNNITEEMIAKTKDIEKKEEFFKNLFDELRTNFTNDIENQRSALTDLKEEIARPSVAFYAHHVTDLALDVTDKIILFDKILTDEGSGYDTSTGIFTAPVGGLYQFTVHVCAQTGKFSVVGLVLDGKAVAATVNYGTNTDTCSSVGAVVRVKSGEQIWVKCTTGHSSAYRLFQNSHRMNTFSGILLNK
ncbi:complement C1q and tumor necrosis factor-related protein 9A-like isoform X3 [Mercenaria mercenaria]|uniref:complement C1q and tumor necrosis factor-related protein 9A-like isoform X3 n=1 Tax=Mercenaria mercenaria TaxID=6596 RepID=UPI00234F6F32|nr:complement C1q and tumor necrosis factor-related protein 9A-like isoform X3 [Mercenaria mercenaria]